MIKKYAICYFSASRLILSGKNGGFPQSFPQLAEIKKSKELHASLIIQKYTQT